MQQHVMPSCKEWRREERLDWRSRVLLWHSVPLSALTCANASLGVSAGLLREAVEAHLSNVLPPELPGHGDGLGVRDDVIQGPRQRVADDLLHLAPQSAHTRLQWTCLASRPGQQAEQRHR